MIGRETEVTGAGVGLRRSAGEATARLVRPLGALERLHYRRRQKSSSSPELDSSEDMSLPLAPINASRGLTLRPAWRRPCTALLRRSSTLTQAAEEASTANLVCRRSRLLGAWQFRRLLTGKHRFQLPGSTRWVPTATTWVRCGATLGWAKPPDRRSTTMRIRLKYFTPALATGVVAVAIAAAPVAAAQETCNTVNTGSTICESPGDAEVNDSLARAATLPQWSSIGGQSGGPFGGSFGGGSR
jgi:hypothetical protein